MSPVLAPDPPLQHAGPEPDEATVGGRTLEDLVSGAWHTLLTGAAAECLSCGAQLHPRHSAGAGVVGGRCDGCGAGLA